MSETLKTQLIYEIAEELIQKIDIEVSKEILNIINKHLYNYDVIEKQTSLIVLDTTSEKLLKMYLGTKRLEGRSEYTLKQYYREIRLLLAFLNCSIEEVTTNGVKMYLMTMKVERNLQNSTVENMRSYLNAVFSWMKKENFIENNPVERIAPIKIKKDIKKSFSEEELKIIKDFCKNHPRNLALVNFLYSTGCRVSEVSSVNIKDINFNEKKLIILGKGNKERIVYLTDEAVQSIQDYLKTREDNNEALFLSDKKKNRLSPNSIRWILTNISEKTGVENIHPHRFRRTLATNLLNNGMAIQVRRYGGRERQQCDFQLTPLALDAVKAYKPVNTDSIFSQFRKEADEKLETLAPSILGKLTSVYDNLGSENPEDWANAVHSCRRILVDLADALYPPKDLRCKAIPFYRETAP